MPNEFSTIFKTIKPEDNQDHKLQERLDLLKHPEYRQLREWLGDDSTKRLLASNLNNLQLKFFFRQSESELGCGLLINYINSIRECEMSMASLLFMQINTNDVEKIKLPEDRYDLSNPTTKAAMASAQVLKDIIQFKKDIHSKISSRTIPEGLKDIPEIGKQMLIAIEGLYLVETVDLICRCLSIKSTADYFQQQANKLDQLISNQNDFGHESTQLFKPIIRKLKIIAKGMSKLAELTKALTTSQEFFLALTFKIEKQMYGLLDEYEKAIEIKAQLQLPINACLKTLYATILHLKIVHQQFIAPITEKPATAEDEALLNSFTQMGI